VVLLDMSMPDMDGLMVAETLRSDPAFRAPILLLTSAGRSGDAARCRELGLAGYPHQADPARTAGGGGAERRGRAAAGTPAPFVTRHTLRENQNRWRLLLAEDNPVNRTMITRMLEKRGHRETGRARAPGARGARGRVLRSRPHGPSDAPAGRLRHHELIREREKGTGRHTPIVRSRRTP